MKSIERGTLIRLNRRTVKGHKGLGFVTCEHFGINNSVDFLLAEGQASALREQVSVVRTKVTIPEPLRNAVPYGKWICEDGREVLFNRRYNPIWERNIKTSLRWYPRQVSPDKYIENIIETIHYYRDSENPFDNKETMCKCLDVLQEWKTQWGIKLS